MREGVCGFQGSGTHVGVHSLHTPYLLKLLVRTVRASSIKTKIFHTDPLIRALQVTPSIYVYSFLKKSEHIKFY